MKYNLLSYIFNFNQIFCNLNCIKCCTFLDLITYNPECKSVLVCQIFTDTTYVNRILACKEQWHRIFFFSRIVHKNKSFAF